MADFLYFSVFFPYKIDHIYLLSCANMEKLVNHFRKEENKYVQYVSTYNCLVSTTY